MKYYINNKQENYSIFSYYLMKCCKVALMYSNDNFYTEKDLYFQYLNELKNGNTIEFNSEKLTFKIREV